MFTSSFNLDLSEASIIEIIGDEFDQTVSQEMKENGVMGLACARIAIHNHVLTGLDEVQRFQSWPSL